MTKIFIPKNFDPVSVTMTVLSVGAAAITALNERNKMKTMETLIAKVSELTK